MATLKLVGIGLGSGFFAALFGVGGGIVIVPLLVFLLAFDQRRASATSLAAILLSSLAGALTYSLHGEVKPGAAALVGIPAVVGVLAGTCAAAARARAAALLRVRAPARRRRGAAARMTIVLVALIGLVGGVLAGLFGVGGGIIFVPTLALGLGLTQLHAEASSLLAILPTALVGSWRQQRYGNIDVRAAATIGVASILGVQAGVMRGGVPPRACAAEALRRVSPADRGARRLAGKPPIVNTSGMADDDSVWIPLVDEPIGSIVERVQADHPEIDRLVSSPHTILAFRTFAYIRVGILLGQLLVENDVPEYDGTETWIEALLA